MAILNLRGDAQSNKTSQKCLGLISDVLLVIVEISQLSNQNVVHNLSSLVSTNSNLVLMISKNSNESMNPEYKKSVKESIESLENKGFKTCNLVLDYGKKNLKNLKKETEMKISPFLVSKDKKRSLKDRLQSIDSLGIKVDEDRKKCIAGMNKAHDLMKKLEEVDRENIRYSKLPLQGEPWQNWSKHFKEERRREKIGDMEFYKYVEDIRDRKKAERIKQIQLIQKSRLFNMFLDNLCEFKGEERLYYLQWLKIYLDRSSKKILPHLRKKLSSKWDQIQQCKIQGDTLATLQTEFKEIEEELVESSFGLEHFIRECAQAYESYKEMGGELSRDIVEKICYLPNIMVELMLLGYPLELMDGDAASVPLTWVNAVLKQLQKKVGHDKKIFVLSVLGIQSSGKSTLLNTMFGLQFSVAAGRCTRGVYAQLIRIPNEYSKCPFDYILVIDTEGLRAAELERDKVQHDNEIATLVVGLGDVTLVNIKGENIAEMEDVLQIVIHALLKMRLVNKSLELQPKCFFLHQNVPAIEAAEKLKRGQQKFMETLNKVTEVAGKNEDKPDYTKFNQVIDFDINTDIIYFSDLYNGDPPMAPTNRGYSDNVNSLKKKLLNYSIDKRSGHLTIQKFLMKLEDLWEGVLDQDFVFNFKNSLELEAYANLEGKLSNLIWNLKKKFIEWQRKKTNEIMSAREIPPYMLEQDCRAYFGNIYELVKRDLEQIFGRSEDRAIIEQWKTRMCKKLKHCHEEASERVIRDVNSIAEKRKIQIEQENNNENYKNEIVSKAIEVAENLRSNGDKDMTNEEIAWQFQEIWDEIMRFLPMKFENERNIENEIISVLYNAFNTDHALVKKALDLRYIEDDDTIRKSLNEAFHKHVSDPIRLGRLKIPCTNNGIQSNDLIDKIFPKVKVLINNLNDSKLNHGHDTEVKKVVTEMFSNLENREFSIKEKERFEVSVTFYTCQYASNIYFKKFESEIVGKCPCWDYGIHPYYQEMLNEKYPHELESILRSCYSDLSIPIRSLNENFNDSKHMVQNCQDLISTLKRNVQKYVLGSEIQGFKQEYVEEILKIIKHKINESHFDVKKELRINLAIKLCCSVLPKFVEKHTLYIEDLNPKVFLKKRYYNTYFQIFINTYKGVTGEEALAKVLSEHLSVAIENSVELKLATTLADNVRCEVTEVITKSALIKAILRKLLEIDEFEQYMLYFEDINACFEKWITFFVDNHLFMERDKGKSCYKEIVSKNIISLTSNIFRDISKSVENLSEDRNTVASLHIWIEMIHESMTSKITVQKQDLINIIERYNIHRLETFMNRLEENLRESQDLSIRKLQEHTSGSNLKELYRIIYSECKGCTEQCPFCSSPCSYNTVDHEKGEGNIEHMAKEHNPQALGKFVRRKTNKMVVESCPELIESKSRFRNPETNWKFKPYKNYQKYYPYWKIDRDRSIKASPYWKWFLVKHNAQLAKRIDAEPADIPKSWRDITKEMAKESIDKI